MHSNSSYEKDAITLCDISLRYPLNTGTNSLFQVTNAGRTRFIYLAFDLLHSKYSKTPLIRTLVIRIELFRLVNLSRILQN